MNINKNIAEYAIITDLKHSFFIGRLLYKIKFLVRLFCSYFNYICFLIIKKKNQAKKHKYKIRNLKKFKGYEAGHASLLRSLFRGFDELNIPYTFNKITPYTKNIILSWCDREDLKIIQKLKNSNKIKKVVTTPVACKYDYDLQYIFPEYECIDKVLVASEQTINKYFKNKVNNKYFNKILPWASGVCLPKEVCNYNNTLDCICYYKKLPINSDIENLLKSYNIKFKNLEYEQYYYDDWIDLLKNTNFVIFYQECIETQGLAITEAWAYDRPTFIKTVDKYGDDKTSPYLSDKSGKFFTTLTELEEIIKEYSLNKEKFLAKYSPQEYVKQNFSDKVSVQKLIQIFENIT